MNATRLIWLSILRVNHELHGFQNIFTGIFGYLGNNLKNCGIKIFAAGSFFNLFRDIIQAFGNNSINYRDRRGDILG